MIVQATSTPRAMRRLCFGVQAARAAFGRHDALWTLVDWQFVFALAIVVAHLTMNELRRNVLLRTLFFVIFIAAALACLYWTFRL